MTAASPPAGSRTESSAFPSRTRAFFALVAMSWQRQARAHLMVWIALGLLLLSALLVLVNTWNDRWNMSYWRVPGGNGVTNGEQAMALERIGYLPWDDSAAAVQHAFAQAGSVVIFETSGFYVFSRYVVLSFLFTTFLLPLWTLSFATEGLGREREAGNLIWVLTRPVPRPTIYMAKFIALLPWCLALNIGGFALLCQLAGWPGRLAFHAYWPAVVVGTFAFAALFHLFGALVRRPSVMAILYVFFLETVAGNLPGHLKRLSISFYIRCMMYERGQHLGVQPDRPHIYLPVSGAFAFWALSILTVVLLGAGMWVFSRKEYLEPA